jgi:glutamate/aspartate transport system substrate-binding protein
VLDPVFLPLQERRTIGYSIELCRALVGGDRRADRARAADPVEAGDADTRIDAVASGQADLECGSTTNNVERQKRVAFSPNLLRLGHQADGAQRLDDPLLPRPGGKTVAVTSAPTNERTMLDLAKKFRIA